MMQSRKSTIENIYKTIHVHVWLYVCICIYSAENYRTNHTEIELTDKKKIIINKNKTNRTRRQTWELGSTHLLAFYKSAMLLRMESQSMKMLPWELIIIYVCILWTVCLAHQCLIPLFSCRISKSVTEYDFSFGKVLREGIISLPEKQLLVQLVWLRSLTVKSRRYVAFANESFLHVQRRTWV